jgi:hypothetical protein
VEYLRGAFVVFVYSADLAISQIPPGKSQLQ